jgi:hypothetical protein
MLSTILKEHQQQQQNKRNELGMSKSKKSLK